MPQKLSLELCEQKRSEVGLSLLSVLALGGFGLVGSWVSMPTSQVRERERVLSVQVSLLLSVVEGSQQQSKEMANWLLLLCLITHQCFQFNVLRSYYSKPL